MNFLIRRLLQVFFDLLYHQLAWAYDAVAWLVSGGRWTKWIHTVLPYLRGTRLLEVGFGRGHLLQAAAESGLHLVGLDASWQMCVGLLSRFGGQFSSGVVNGYAQYAPFPNQTFDQIICTFPAEFIADRRALAEFFRLLVPGGELLILPFAWITGRSLTDRLLAWLFRFTGEAPPRHPQLETAFQTALTAIGFTVTFLYPAAPSSQVMLILATKPFPSSPPPPPSEGLDR